jgi:protein gp37
VKGIPWTDSTWNPIRGCSHVSRGCQNCYAERQAVRFCGPGRPWHGFADRNGWSGRVALVHRKLMEPIRWRRSRRVFVNSMSDLFHESLSQDAILEVFRVMYSCPRHTFQALTKRATRMQDVMAVLKEDLCKYVWPLPNLHLGVSCEDQAAADKRIPLLLQTPAAVRWVSLEPILERVDLDDRRDWLTPNLVAHPDGVRLDHVVVGGENGPGARPCRIQWVRDIVRKCQAAAVPVFVKGLGAHVLDEQGDRVRFVHPQGADPSEWPEDLRVREFPRTGA